MAILGYRQHTGEWHIKYPPRNILDTLILTQEVLGLRPHWVIVFSSRDADSNNEPLASYNADGLKLP